MKTSILKKSILDYAIKGELSARFRRENANLNALSEIESYNADILIKRENLQKELKILESNLKKPIPSLRGEAQAIHTPPSQSKKISSPSLRASETSEAIHTNAQEIKAQIKELKQELEKCKIITPLNIESTKLDSAPLLSGDRNSKATSAPSLRASETSHNSSLRASETSEAIHTPLPNDKAKTIDCHDFAYAKSRNDAFTPPFEIPKTWTWVRLGDIAVSNIGLTYSPNDIKKEGIPILRANNIQNGKIDYNDLVYIDEKIQIKENCFVKKQDILMCARNGSSKLVGKVALIEKDNMVFGAFMTIIRSRYNIFLKYYFESQCFRGQLEGVSTTTINQITQNMLKNFAIPLPPLKEQQEIARILDSLISLANEFESIKEELKRIEKRIEKSLLKLALEGNLSKGYRRENPHINAYSEIESYNANILTKRENLQKELKILESKLKKPIPSSPGKAETIHTPPSQSKTISSPSLRASETSEAIHTNAKEQIKAQIKELKQELEKCKIITPLESSIENCSFQYKFIESKTPDSMDFSKLDSTPSLSGDENNAATSSPSLRASETSHNSSLRASETSEAISTSSLQSKRISAPSLQGEANTISSPSLRGEAEAIHTPLPNDKEKTMGCHDFAYAKSRNDVTYVTNCYNKSYNDAFTPPFKIPPTWTWVRLGDICEIILGKTPKREVKEYWEPKDYKWVSIADMKERESIFSTKDSISELAKQECFGNFIFKKGTLILSFKLTIGKTSILGFDGYHNEGIASIIPKFHKENEEIFKHFLLLLLSEFTQFIESTGAIKGETLNKAKLIELPIPLPPLKEQEFISKELEKLFTLTKCLRLD